MEEKTIKYKNLSAGLKTIIVISWVTATLYALAFAVGFIQGILGI